MILVGEGGGRATMTKVTHGEAGHPGGHPGSPRVGRVTQGWGGSPRMGRVIQGGERHPGWGASPERRGGLSRSGAGQGRMTSVE